MQVQKKVAMLIEQTDFLLGQQREALKFTEEIFSGFIKDVQKKVGQAGLKQGDINSLNKISKMLAEKLGLITEDMLDDIEFLEKQLETLKAITPVKDDAKAQSMLDMIFDKDEELLSTKEFKEITLEDVEIAKQDLVSVINDLKEALSENNIRDVEFLLEAMGSEEDIEIEFEEDDTDEENCDSCEDSCCKSNKNKNDIFKGCCQSDDDADFCCGSNKKSRK